MKVTEYELEVLRDVANLAYRLVTDMQSSRTKEELKNCLFELYDRNPDEYPDFGDL